MHFKCSGSLYTCLSNSVLIPLNQGATYTMIPYLIIIKTIGMKIQILKMTMAAICIVAFAMVLKSCKKVDQHGDTLTPKTKEQMIAEFKAQNPNLGVEFFNQVNQRFTYSYYEDKNE